MMDRVHLDYHRTRTILRRGSAVLAAVGLLSSICVYFGHHWFHYQLLPALGLSDALGDSIGGFVIILVAYIGQRIVSLALFHDTELGSTLAARQLQQANQGLQLALSELNRLAGTDKLTGAWNRRRLEEAVRSEMDRLARYDHPLSLLVLDADFFKSVNDRYGHGIGDQVLVELASQLRVAQRTSDSLTRWGGEEFIVLCPNTTLSTASLLAERLREMIAKTDFPEVGHITGSIGVAECMPEETWEQWFQRADAALYQAKTNGRNQVQFAPETPRRGNVGEKVDARFLQLVWHKAYESGHETIDREHQALFGRANDLLAAMLSGRPADETGEIVDAFIRVVVQHFQNEEAIITAAGYPGAALHADTHRELSTRAVSLTDRFRNGMLEAGELFQFLTHDVVTKHMLGADREFFPYLETRR
ncbi:MAG: diguanylate cyclase [Sulfuritalea sp.]|jgi:diguanylate cyclase (GGDEF)-like protein/hemerythrin-like metal-binding protein|nr:diguanylate cyclase [Sulfuritalea sp.]